jgi:hypothetical protein
MRDAPRVWVLIRRLNGIAWNEQLAALAEGRIRHRLVIGRQLLPPSPGLGRDAWGSVTIADPGLRAFVDPVLGALVRPGIDLVPRGVEVCTDEAEALGGAREPQEPAAPTAPSGNGADHRDGAPEASPLPQAPPARARRASQTGTQGRPPNSREPAYAEMLPHFARSLLDPTTASEASE